MKLLEGARDLLKHLVLNKNLLETVGAILFTTLFIVLRKISIKFIFSGLYKITRKTKIKLNTFTSNRFNRPAEIIFMLIGMRITILILRLPIKLDAFLNKIIGSLLLCSVFWILYRSVDVVISIFKGIKEKSMAQFDDMLLPFARNGMKIIVIVIGILTILQEWYENIGGLLAGLGLGGLAFALAAKDTAANMFGSITIMVDRPFNIGDWIMTPKVEGTVEDIGFRSTKIRTSAQALVTIPNSDMSSDPITNWSRMGKRRITFRLGIAYSTGQKQVEECLEQLRTMLKNHPEVHPDTIMVYFERFGESALEILIYFFTRTTSWQKFLGVQEDINLKTMKILRELNILVAFPSRIVYVERLETAERKE